MKRLLLLPLLLAACGAPDIAPVETRPISPPAALLTCRAAPAVPREAETQREVARFIVRLAEAGEDCRSKLADVRAWAKEEAPTGP